MDTLFTQTDTEKLQQVAERIRQICIAAAMDGYETAASDGLCHEGAWEAAISAMQTVELVTLLQTTLGDQNSSR
ncbi:MAG: acetyltransferase [Chloroflexi bacterium]|nr:acetyltransferase [Chloroflexota bacterium]